MINRYKQALKGAIYQPGRRPGLLRSDNQRSIKRNSRMDFGKDGVCICPEDYLCSIEAFHAKYPPKY